jgi:hypothetical protein
VERTDRRGHSRRVPLVEACPMTVTAKVQKYLLRQEAAAMIKDSG